MIMSPIFPERSWMAPVIFMIIATGYSLKKINKDESIIKTLTLTVTPILLLVFVLSYYRALNDTIKLNNNWKDRIEYIEEEKSKGNKDIEVYKIIPIDKHVALYNLEDLNINPKIWPNNSIAKYFDINSIKIKE